MVNTSFGGPVKRSRGSNIAVTLVKNSKSAFMLAIEIHNKPVCTYRLQSVVIFIIHSWELLLKAYCYKYLQDKKILHKDADNRYQQLSHIIQRIYDTNTNEFRILKDNIDTLNSYRNLIIHACIADEIDQLIFELVAKSVILYRDFIRTFFASHDLEGVVDTPILPIAFKLPYTPIDILTHNFSSTKTSKDVLNFIDSLQKRITRLSQDGIEESIFVSVKAEFISENNMKNSNITATLLRESGIPFQKETKNRLVNDKGAQPMRGMLNHKEAAEQFPIPTKKNLTTKVRSSVGEDLWKSKGGASYFQSITKELQEEYEGSEWYPNTQNGGKRYTQHFYDLIMSKYV